MSSTDANSDRRRRLDELVRRIASVRAATQRAGSAGQRGDREPAEARPAAASPADIEPLALDQLAPGTEVLCQCPEGPRPYWLIRRALVDFAPDSQDVARRYCHVMRGARQRLDELSASRELCIASDCGPEDLLFMDIETCGLFGMPVFLVGTMYSDGGGLVFDQLLARDYSEEAAVLKAFLERCASARLLVTFNGKSFDMNMIRERAVFHRLDWPAEPLGHLDLLHESRRRWRGRLPNCRLQTLEAYLLGRRRVDDIPGWAIPQAYHDYVADGNARRLGMILHHNLLDMLTMAELVCLMLTGQDPLE